MLINPDQIEYRTHQLKLEKSRPCGNKSDKEFQNIGESTHLYYRNEFNSIPFSPAFFSSMWALLQNFALLLKEFSPATLTGFGIACAEALDVPLAGANIFGDPNRSGEDGEITVQRKESSIALVQLGSGILGLGGLIYEKISHHEENNTTIFEKSLLTIGALLTSAQTFMTGMEKSLCASISGGKPGRPEVEGMAMNAQSDLRGAVHNLAMSLYVWLPVGLVKTVFDTVIPYLGIRSGLIHIRNNGISPIILHKKSIPLSPFIKNCLSVLSLDFNHPVEHQKEGDVDKGYPLPLIAGRAFFNLRNRFIIPLIRKSFGFHFIPEIELVENENGKHLWIKTPDISKLDEIRHIINGNNNPINENVTKDLKLNPALQN